MDELKPGSFFDLKEQRAADLWDGTEWVWEALDRIKPFILETIQPNSSLLRKDGEFIRRTCALWQGRVITEGLTLTPGDTTKGQFQVFENDTLLEGAAVVYAGAALMDDLIELGPGVVVEPGALIKGPTIIGPRTEVRQGAYIRGSCLVGRSCVVGHTTEMKNAVMLDNAKAGHFAYLGDSILGRDVNLGAGTKLANLKIMPWPFRIKMRDQIFQVDRRKFGAILGDKVETGCNTVTSPGTLMAPLSLAAPNSTVPSGYHPPRTFFKPGGPASRSRPERSASRNAQG